MDIPSPVAVVKTIHGRTAVHVGGSRGILRGSGRTVLRDSGRTVLSDSGRIILRGTTPTVSQVGRNVGALLSRLAIWAKAEATHVKLVRHVGWMFR